MVQRTNPQITRVLFLARLAPAPSLLIRMNYQVRSQGLMNNKTYFPPRPIAGIKATPLLEGRFLTVRLTGVAISARPSAWGPSPLSSSSLSPGELGPRRAFHRQGAETRSRDEAIPYKGRQVTRQDRAMATSHGQISPVGLASLKARAGSDSASRGLQALEACGWRQRSLGCRRMRLSFSRLQHQQAWGPCRLHRALIPVHTPNPPPSRIHAACLASVQGLSAEPWMCLPMEVLPLP